MKNQPTCSLGQPVGMALSLLSWQLCQGTVHANPTGGTVAQGSASFKSSGSQFTVTTAGNAYINWQSFNIAAGETTTFVQPSATSVVWNQINDPNASQILGTINANGYVVLQNQNGFLVGGQASINAHGLVMTTASSSVPNLASGGAWTFSAPPPSAKIINYGQINISGGGPAFLIANDIVNGIDGSSVGTISAPGGQIGLYAGETVLVSPTPDGRSLSAQVTLPQGSVDNEGHLIADAGTIAAQAQTVNQNGIIQANSARNINGIVELVASDSLTLGANSTISAQGDATSAQPSTGGFVVLQSGNSFADTAGSTINVAGQSGGQDGIIEISGSGTSASSLQSTLSTYYALLINPYDLTLSDNATDSSAVDPNDSTRTDPNLNVSDLANYSQIDLHAQDNIELASPLILPDATSASSLSLTAGNNLTLDPGANLVAGMDWNVNLTAGAALPAGVTPTSDNDGIYLNGGAFVQTQNGYIDATAANEVIIQDSVQDPITGAILTPSGAIRTLAGGSISVTAQAGDVNSGDDLNGFNFGLTAAPWYNVNAANLGGISTAAGGNVTITAGGSVTSYLPTQNDYNNDGHAGFDGGSGAFGGGNVTITAGTTVAGNYVLANGVGTITAGGDAGVPVTETAGGFALSLVKGSWTVSAPNIYLDDVMNPNGVFNDASTTIQYGRGGKPLPSGGPGAHLFNYDPAASVTLNGANSVEITGASVPLLPGSDVSGLPIPILLPPSLTINAGAGGIVLDADVVLFPSPAGNVSLTTTAGGDFSSRQDPNNPQDVITYNFQMSDSGQSQWNSTAVGLGQPAVFGIGDHAASPPELDNPNPVDISISGSIDDLNLYTTKATDLTVNGNMYNASFIGENLHASDVTTITVDGSITFSPIFALETLTTPLNSAGIGILSQIVDDNAGDPNSVANAIPAGDVGNATALNALALSETIQKLNPSLPPNLGFVYNASTLQLGYDYQMNSTVRSALESPLETIQYAFGQPVIALGNAQLGQNPAQYYFVTTPVTFAPLTLPANALPGTSPISAVEALYQTSQSSVANALSLPAGFQIGGPGQFVVQAGSLDLGASGGIVSWGGGNGSESVGGGVNYANLDTLTGAAGASVDVNVSGNIGMLTSTIATIGGGTVTVASTGGEIDLGLAGVPFTPPSAGNLAFGIFTSAGGDVTVTANHDINIDTARIATFNGGNLTIESYNGDVNAGNGVNEDLQVLLYYPNDPILDTTPEMTGPRPFGSGILALAPSPQFQIPGNNGIPGNITVTTPNGDIISTLGGISQFALNASVGAGPVVNLTAGTPGVDYILDPSGTLKDSAGHVDYGLVVNGVFQPEGNIDLGDGGVLGGAVNLSAQGNIAGLIVSRQNTSVTAQQNVTITVLSGGGIGVTGKSITGDLIANGNANVSGGDEGLTVVSESTSGSAGVANSLGTATASASATGAAAVVSKASPDNSGTDSDNLDKKGRGQSVALKVKRVTIILPGKT